MTKEEKCSNTQKNRIVIHKGNEELRIYKDDLEKYLADGWEKGISEKHRETLKQNHLGQQAWNKGKTWSDEIKTKMSQNYKYHEPWNKGKSYHFDEETKKRKQEAEYITKSKNKSFNTSKPEKIYLLKLKQQYKGKTILTNYKDEKRYPFRCDFYIVEDDLFIELNNHWTHGEHPFDKNNPKDLQKLAEWQEKAKTSKFYQKAIEVWTIRDPLKIKIAKENNLNYKLVYNL